MNRQNQIRKKKVCFLALLMSFLMLFPAGDMVVQAATAESGVYVYDEADLFDAEEEQKLQKVLTELSTKNAIGIYVLTSKDSNAGATDRYIEDFYDEGYASGKIVTDAVLLHIDMQERYVNMQAYGSMQQMITDQDINFVLDEIYPDLADADYEQAAETFADYTDYYANYEPFYTKVWFHLIVALVVGAIAVAIMAGSSGGKMTAGASKYQDSAQTGIRARRDEYIRTSVTKRRKPQSNSSGGGGGHRSSGGHSHSSGGRHF